MWGWGLGGRGVRGEKGGRGRPGALAPGPSTCPTARPAACFTLHTSFLPNLPHLPHLPRPAFARAAGALAWLPLAGSLASYGLELVDSMQGYYTYVEG